VLDKEVVADVLFIELFLPSVILGKYFAECFSDFADCFKHSTKHPIPAEHQRINDNHNTCSCLSDGYVYTYII
jgi:hypothetical protein